ncbi:MAG: hypothetical protein JXR56_05625, partial [Candidatus Cloacimonetes bacterium]|nr:hypothetical protein [Candidatus Cloacimonadota bacterium]
LVQPSINIPDVTPSGIVDFEIPIWTYAIQDTDDINEYQFELTFNSVILDIYGYKVEGSITEESFGDVTFTVLSSGVIEVSCVCSSPIIAEEDNSLLITLLAEAKSFGSSAVDFTYFKYDDVDAYRISGTTINIPFKQNKAYLNIYNDRNSKNIFNPRLNEKITIVYGAEVNGSMSNSKVRVRIYDAMGRHQATLVDENIINSLGTGTFLWDGKATNHRLLPPGMYICHVEVIDRKTGEKKETTQPIVISTEL